MNNLMKIGLCLGAFILVCSMIFIVSDGSSAGDVEEGVYGDEVHGYAKYTFSDDHGSAILITIKSVGMDNTFTVPLYINEDDGSAIYSSESTGGIPVTTIGNGSSIAVADSEYHIVVTANVKTIADSAFRSLSSTMEFDGAHGITFYAHSILPREDKKFVIPDGSTLHRLAFARLFDDSIIKIGLNCKFEGSDMDKFYPRLKGTNIQNNLNFYSQTPISELLPTSEIEKAKEYDPVNGIAEVQRKYCYKVRVWEDVAHTSESLTDFQKGYLNGYCIVDGDDGAAISKTITDGDKKYYMTSSEDAVNIIDWETVSVENSADSQFSIKIPKVENAGYTIMVTVGSQKYYPDEQNIVKMPALADKSVLAVDVAQWSIVFLDGEGGEQIGAIVVKDRSVLTVPDVPIRQDHVFKCWTSNGQEYNFGSEVRSDLTLIATWELGQSYGIELKSSVGMMSVTDGVDNNGRILEGSDVTVSFGAPEKVEILSWTVKIGEDTNTYSESSPTDGVTIGGSLGDTITIADIHNDVTVSINVRYISESNAPEPIVSTDMPTSADDLVNKWRFGGGMDAEGMVWKGGMSEPLILDECVYVRDGFYLYKIDAGTGLVLASAPSEMATTYFHQLGYLGQGRILDYYTEIVYDEDLNDLGYKVKDWAVFDDSTGCFYTVGSDYVCRYSESSTITDGYLTPEWKVSVDETVNGVTTKYSVFRNYNAVSQPLILDGRIYWLSSKYTDDSLKNWNVYLCYTSGDGLNHVELTGLKSKLLDNGWLTTDGTNIYVTSYGGGLLGGGSGGVGVLAVYYPEKNAASYFNLNASTLVSAFIPVGDIAFVKGDTRIMVYDMNDFAYVQSGTITAPSRIAEIDRLEKSHGSITVNTAHLDEGKVYVYFAGYNDGKIYVCVYDIAAKTWTYSKISNIHVYCSQGIKTTISGDLIYYDDSNLLFCYTSSEKNSYRFYVSQGTETVTVEGSGKDPGTAADATGLISVSNGNLLGARTSRSGTFENGYSLYALINGVWTSQESFVNSINYPMWAIVKDGSQLPSDGTEVTSADGGTYKYDYVAGHTVKTTLDGREISSFSAYEGMILTIQTGLDCDGELEDITDGITVSGVFGCETRWILSAIAIDSGIKQIITLIVKNIPDADMNISITTAAQPLLYEVTLDLDGGGSSSITVAAGWTYDSTTSTWSKSFEQGVTFPIIADPTKAGAGVVYSFRGWSEAFPATVTESKTYVATYTSSADIGTQYRMAYQTIDSGAMRVYTITIDRSSGTDNIEDARLLVIANYGGHYVNVYSKIDLDSNGHAVETVKLSTDGLTGLDFEIVEGFPTGAFDSHGSLSPGLA